MWYQNSRCEARSMKALLTVTRTFVINLTLQKHSENFFLSPLGLFMWSRGGCGTVSGSVGDVGASVVAQTLRPEGVNINVNSPSAQWIRHQRHGPPRCDSSELADSPIRAEAIKVKILVTMQAWH